MQAILFVDFIFGPFYAGFILQALSACNSLATDKQPYQRQNAYPKVNDAFTTPQFSFDEDYLVNALSDFDETKKSDISKQRQLLIFHLFSENL